MENIAIALIKDSISHLSRTLRLIPNGVLPLKDLTRVGKIPQIYGKQLRVTGYSQPLDDFTYSVINRRRVYVPVLLL